MVNLLLFCMASIGLTNIIVDSRIKDLVINSFWYKPFRNLCAMILPSSVYEALECHQCTGTWVGFLLGWIMFGGIPTILACGFASSFLARLFEVIHVCLDVWYMNNMHTEVDDG
jgi:hypothetical protein